MSADPSRPAPDGAQQGRMFTVGVLFFVSVVAGIDRHILTLLVEYVKADLQISDVQFSLLTGLAFSLFFAICGIPAGIIVDRFSRTKILGWAMVLWSGATFAAGLATSYVQLFIARMLVGVGEATEAPSGTSIVADLYPRRHLAKAMAMLSLGGLLGAGGALVGGGAILRAAGDLGTVTLPLIGEIKTWKAVFFAAGVPGLLLAPILLIVVRDPPRLRLLRDGAGVPLKSRYRQVLEFAKSHRGTVGFTAGGYIFYTFAQQAFAGWSAAYLIRAHDLPTSSVGLLMGPMQITVGLLGLSINSWWIDRQLERGNHAAPLRLARLYATLNLIPLATLPFVEGIVPGLINVFAIMYLNTGLLSASVAHARLLPNQIRAQYTATYLICTNIMAGMLAPVVVATLTDHFFEDPKMVGYSMAIVAGTGIVCAVLLLSRAASHFAKTVEHLDQTT